MKIKIILVLAFLALVAANFYVISNEDDEAPVISFPSETASYSEGMTDEELLEGVTAYDETDGDVTDSLRIGEILESEDGSYVTVIYVARDSSNNIVQTPRILQTVEETDESEEAEDSEAIEESEETEGTEDSEEEISEEETAGASDSDTADNAESTADEAEEVDANELGRQDNEEAIAALSDSAPRMYLTQYAITIAAGSTFQALSYVEDIEDDSDSRELLFTRIQVVGNVDTSTPGVYEVIFYVVDTDGNGSNQASLTVTVE